MCATPKFATLQQWGRAAAALPLGAKGHGKRPPVLLAIPAGLLALGVAAGAAVFGQAAWRRARQQNQVGRQAEEHSLLLAQWSNSASASDGTCSSHSTSSLGLTRRARMAAMLGAACRDGGPRRGLEIMALDPLQEALAHCLASQPKAMRGAAGSSGRLDAACGSTGAALASAHTADVEAKHQAVACGSAPKPFPCQERASSHALAGGVSSASGSQAPHRQWGLDTYSLHLATGELEVKSRDCCCE